MRLILARKISTLLLVLATCWGTAYSQSNAPRYDLRWFNLGFLAGMNLSQVRIQYGSLRSPNYPIPGVLYNLEIKQTPGITLGMITNLRLGNNFDLRFIPAIALQERRFNYYFTSSVPGQDSVMTRALEMANVDLPLMLKFKSDVYRNHRVYVMAGLKYSRNLVSDKRARDDPNLIRVSSNDFSLEFAFGIDIYSDRVKLCPEIRYSMGLVNIYSPQYTRYGNAIQNLTTQSLLFCINFE